jgi:hypothetical protein
MGIQKEIGTHCIKDLMISWIRSATEDVNHTDHGFRKPRSGRKRSKASQVVNLQNLGKKLLNKDNLKIGTWNIKTILKTAKLKEVKGKRIY